MSRIEVFYDIDDTLVESKDVFKFLSNAFSYSVLSNSVIDLSKVNDSNDVKMCNQFIEDHYEDNSSSELNKLYHIIKNKVTENNLYLIDYKKSMGVFPYNKETHFESLIKTCENFGFDMDEDYLKELSCVPFESTFLEKDTIRSLEYMLNGYFPDFNLNIFTKGEDSTQLKKLDNLGLYGYLDLKNIHVMSEKNTDKLYEVLSTKSYDNSLIIGNSLNDEIIPAINCNSDYLWVENEDLFSRDIDIDKNKIKKYNLNSFKRYISDKSRY